MYRVVPRRTRIYTRYTYIRVYTCYIRMWFQKVWYIRLILKAYIRPYFQVDERICTFLLRFWAGFGRIEHILDVQRPEIGKCNLFVCGKWCLPISARMRTPTGRNCLHRCCTIGYSCTQFIVLSTINDAKRRNNPMPMRFIAIMCITSIVCELTMSGKMQCKSTVDGNCGAPDGWCSKP